MNKFDNWNDELDDDDGIKLLLTHKIPETDIIGIMNYKKTNIALFLLLSNCTSTQSQIIRDKLK